MTTHVPLTPEVDMLRKEFDRLAADADALAAPLTDEQFHRPPAAGGWPVAQCIDHLNSAARAYLPNLDEAISGAIKRGMYGEGPFKYGLFARLFIWSMEPPPKIRVKNPAVFQPAPNRSRHEIMAAFRAYQVQFNDRLRQASGLDLARVKVLSPASKVVRLPLGAVFEVITAHERRHLWQARQVISHL